MSRKKACHGKLTVTSLWRRRWDSNPRALAGYLISSRCCYSDFGRRKEIIEYILDAMRDCPSDIRNIRAYMLTVLYNASLTIDNYYSALVNRDMYGGRK